MYKDIIESVGKEITELHDNMRAVKGNLENKITALKSIIALAEEDNSVDYDFIIDKVQEQVSGIERELRGLRETLNTKTTAREAIIMLQASHDRDNGRLAVQKSGVCPFPRECNLILTCTKDYCSHDVCSNGHTYRMS